LSLVARDAYHQRMRATRAIIRLDHLRNNLDIIRERTASGEKRPALCLAVKADAYGHGIREIGKAAQRFGVDALAVATVDEGLELRQAGVTRPILLYSLPLPGEIESIVTAGITPLVCDFEFIDLLEKACRPLQTSVTVHLKIDSGMGRIGCHPSQATDLAVRITSSKLLTLGGVSTHLAASDTADPAFTRNQLAVFEQAVGAIRDAGVEPGIVHAANSGGVLEYPGSWYDMVRPGIAAYGYYPSDEQARSFDLLPVMELKSKVVLIKQVEKGTPISYGMKWHAPRRTWIGTVPVGYGDGYSRSLSNKGTVVIGEDAYPVVGTVCMDQIMIDLGMSCRVNRFDDVILFGSTPGAPTAETVAEWCGTIPYEITCMISSRVPRIPVESAEEEKDIATARRRAERS
jgi:alanine racemase